MATNHRRCSSTLRHSTITDSRKFIHPNYTIRPTSNGLAGIVETPARRSAHLDDFSSARTDRDMPDNSQPAQPGWYPTPDGRQRFWNGATWLDLPEPSASPGATASRRRPSKKLILIAAGALVVLGVAGTTAKLVHDSNVKSEQQAAQTAADDAAQKESDRLAAVAEEKEKKDDAERLTRALAVTKIESSVKTMAEDHVAKGRLDGPVISVSCSPVGGGSTDDLTETTTVFECFAATDDNGDGTMSGYKYNSTMNWSTGSFTYGLGAP